MYERGQHIGYADLTQGTVGVQVGGQSFSELLVFEHKAALDRFKAGEFGVARGLRRGAEVGRRHDPQFY